MNQQIDDAIQDLCMSLTERGVMRDSSYEKMGKLIHESLAEDKANNNKQGNEQDIKKKLGVYLKNHFRRQAQTYPSLNVGSVHCKLFKRFLLIKNQI